MDYNYSFTESIPKMRMFNPGKFDQIWPQNRNRQGMNIGIQPVNFRKFRPLEQKRVP